VQPSCTRRQVCLFLCISLFRLYAVSNTDYSLLRSQLKGQVFLEKLAYHRANSPGGTLYSQDLQTVLDTVHRLEPPVKKFLLVAKKCVEKTQLQDSKPR